jgi:hypothetical protein
VTPRFSSGTFDAEKVLAMSLCLGGLGIDDATARSGHRDDDVLPQNSDFQLRRSEPIENHQALPKALYQKTGSSRARAVDRKRRRTGVLRNFTALQIQ